MCIMLVVLVVFISKKELLGFASSISAKNVVYCCLLHKLIDQTKWTRFGVMDMIGLKVKWQIHLKWRVPTKHFSLLE